jgi:hypothetical protein
MACGKFLVPLGRPGQVVSHCMIVRIYFSLTSRQLGAFPPIVAIVGLIWRNGDLIVIDDHQYPPCRFDFFSRLLKKSLVFRMPS